MSDEAALLRAIADNPEDIPLRLVYADWCEEQGRTPRAALIRGQCALDPVLASNGEGAGRYDWHDPRFLEPSDLSQELREDVLAPYRAFAVAVGSEWSGAAGFTSPRSRWYEVRRGFVESQELTSVSQATQWLPHAAGILAQTPITSLRLLRFEDYRGRRSDPRTLPVLLLESLLAVSGIGRIRNLELSAFRLDAAGAKLLLAKSAALRVESLRLRHNSLSRKTVGELEASFGEALRIDDSRLTDDDIPF